MLALAALVSLAPYDVPCWLPALLERLAGYFNAPQPIKGVVTKAFADFKRTHQVRVRVRVRLGVSPSLGLGLGYPNPNPNPGRLESLGFETAVFDEAAQAGELATLVPLQHGARRV